MREAVFSFRAECYLASVVMLGVASERLVLLLGEAVIVATDGRYQQWVAQFRSGRVPFSRKLELLRDRVMQQLGSLPGAMPEKARFALQSVAEITRITRNEAGHPLGIPLDRGQVRIYLNTAGLYFQVLEELVEHYASIIPVQAEAP